jgi:hypothetical protein
MDDDSVDHASKAPSTRTQQKNFKRGLLKRDGSLCLLCWATVKLLLQGAHIIAQKRGATTDAVLRLLASCGIDGLYHLSNGLVLCNTCHILFDQLNLYFEAAGPNIEDGTIALFLSNEPNNVADLTAIALSIRNVFLNKPNESKPANMIQVKAMETVMVGARQGFRVVHFDNTPSTLPNRTALMFHKAACLIWHMSGGADPDPMEEEDDEDMVDHMRGSEVPIYEKLGRVADWVHNSTSFTSSSSP